MGLHRKLVCMTGRETTFDGDLGRLASLTRRYARFSVSAGGLGSVLGGALVIVAYLVGALVPEPSTGVRFALASAPLVWIAVKELLRSRYYQRHGRVEEARSGADERLHLGLTLFTAVVSVGVFAFVVARAWPGPFDAGTVGYLAYVAAMPLLVWLFMRTPLEFVAGVFLVAQAALMLAGGSYRLGEQPQAPVAGVVLVVLGVLQHREFLRLERDLRSLRGSAS